MVKKSTKSIHYYEPKDKNEHEDLEHGHLDADVQDVLDAPLDEE